ncbi:MAG: hypothetical protein FJ088_05795 [Deltaproteobacteria bacterium]|nr:hypothetical protein [Deltaproteobacteria bacterium]
MKVLFFVLFLSLPSILAAQETNQEKKEGTEVKGAIIIPEKGTEKELVKIVDDSGTIYLERGYKGIVPGIRNDSAIKEKEEFRKENSIEWIGFQPMKTFSRVFIKINGSPKYVIHKENPSLIIIEFTDAVIPMSNEKRDIITSAFPTSVEKITVKETEEKKEKKILFNIYLKKPAGYLYREEGGYLFVDVEL